MYTDTILEVLKSSLSENPYFNAGAGLFGVGLGLSVLKRTGVVFSLLFRRNFTLTLEVPSYDKSYPWVLQWIAMKAKPVKGAGFLKSGAGQHLSVDTSVIRLDSGKITAGFEFIPSTGIHYLYHGGKIIQVERTRASQTLQGAGSAPFESVTLRTIGRDTGIFKKLLEEARFNASTKEEGWTIIYKAIGHEWRPFGYPRRKRPIESVILSYGTSETIVSDLKEFTESKAWYENRGVPYRRGFLLHGPPGCGKSSFIYALAGHFDFSLCVLSLSEPGMSSDRLDYLLTHAPMQSIIVLEDIDAALPSREQNDNPTTPRPNSNPAAYAGMSNVTMSGLLNALDGVSSTEGRVLFMTTNYITRPGRVDRVFEIDLCTKEQITRLFNKFYPFGNGEELHPFAEEFANKIGDYNCSAAQIQGFLLLHKERPDIAVKEADAFSQAMKNAKR